MTRALVAGGVDPKLPTFDGTTSLMLAAGIGRIEGGITRPVPDEVLVRAAAYAIEAGNGVNTANLFGLTAVHGAAANESDGLIQFLAQKGARVDTKDREGRTPADFADGLLIDNSIPVPRARRNCCAT